MHDTPVKSNTNQYLLFCWRTQGHPYFQQPLSHLQTRLAEQGCHDLVPLAGDQSCLSRACGCQIPLLEGMDSNSIISGPSAHQRGLGTPAGPCPLKILPRHFPRGLAFGVGAPRGRPGVWHPGSTSSRKSKHPSPLQPGFVTITWLPSATISHLKKGNIMVPIPQKAVQINPVYTHEGFVTVPAHSKLSALSYCSQHLEYGRCLLHAAQSSV